MRALLTSVSLLLLVGAGTGAHAVADEPECGEGPQTVILRTPSDATAPTGSLTVGFGDDDGCNDAGDPVFAEVRYDVSDQSDPEVDACGGGSGSYGHCVVHYARSNGVPIP